MPEIGAAKATTVIVAAMESAGATIQSDMLDFVNSSDGMGLAGLLYLLAVASGIIIYASGGAYRWGRYLLIGPPLFFFLVTIRSDSDGTEWSFGTKDFSPAAVEKALRGVEAPSNGGGTRVSTVYHFWNVFMSEMSQSLIALLDLEDSDSQFNFIQKVERFMQGWNFSQIKDPQLRRLIKLTLSSQCKDYFHHLRVLNNPDSLLPEKEMSSVEVGKLKDRPVAFVPEEGTADFITSDLHDYMKEKNMVGLYTCQTMWEAIINEVLRDVSDSLDKTLEREVQPEQDVAEIRETFSRKMGEYVEKYSGRVNDSYVNGNAAALSALNWIAARSLYIEIYGTNETVQRGVQGVESSLHQNGFESYLPGQASGFNEDVTSAIRQFNVTDRYAQRSEFVTAALSLPYYQGLGLLILSAAYPFFAMMVVVPGRALNFFSWLGLWAWLKLWDVGFAVVMMIDNMLYSMMPKGQNLDSGDLENAGTAWEKLLEIDPNYSQAVYYNVIGTCLFAVPLVTGFFVKGGGGELLNLIHQSWQGYSSRIAGGPASFARAVQADGYMKDLREQIDQVQSTAASAYEHYRNTHVHRSKDGYKVDSYLEGRTYGQAIDQLKQDINAIKSSNQLKTIGGFSAAQLEVRLDQLKRRTELEQGRWMAEARFKAANTYGRYAANRAVAAKYYSHDLVFSGDLPYNARKNQEIGAGYEDLRMIGDVGTDTVFGAVKGALGGGGK